MRALDKSVISEYAGDIFGYCIKRLNNIEDAKDLSQEILLEALAGLEKGNITNLRSWIWKVAHNRLARFISKNKYPVISLDEGGFIEAFVCENDGCDEENAEEHSAVFNAVQSIAEAHRTVIIDYYVSGLSCGQIAKKYSLSLNTVKTRLYYGREKMKKRWQAKMNQNHIYEKIPFFICGNGFVDPHRYLTRQIARAITVSCYEKAIDVEEISLKTGIPCIYIEDEIPQLLKGEILSCEGKKYLTNIIIHSSRFVAKAEAELRHYSKEIAAVSTDILDQYDGKIRDIGFYGNAWKKEKLWWFLLPILIKEACEEARRQNGRTARCGFPLRKDGGKGWIFVSEEGSRRYFSGCNGYWRENGIFTYYWSQKYFSEEINNCLLRLEDMNSLEDLEPERLAEGIKYGLISHDKGTYTWNIAVFTKDQMESLNKLKRIMAGPLSLKLLPLVDKLSSFMYADTPKRLQSQIKGVFGAELNSVIAMVCDDLEEEGKLESPECEYFTSQILLTEKK